MTIEHMDQDPTQPNKPIEYTHPYAKEPPAQPTKPVDSQATPILPENPSLREMAVKEGLHSDTVTGQITKLSDVASQGTTDAEFAKEALRAARKINVIKNTTPPPTLPEEDKFPPKK